jgi:rRNA-processing protein FCF1
MKTKKRSKTASRKRGISLLTLSKLMKANRLARINRLDTLEREFDLGISDKLGTNQDQQLNRLKREHELLEREFDRRLAKRHVPVVIYGGKTGRTITTLDKL